jgi:hypothetical protein
MKLSIVAYFVNPMKARIVILTLVICVLIGIGQSALRAQQAERSTLDAVFTRDQAGRGRELVIKIGCGGCHNSDLGGGIEETPSLVGNEFIAVWTGQWLKDLDSQLTVMPGDGSYKMSPQERADVMAFLLGVNGAPMGNTELAPDPETYAKVRIKFP